MYSLSATSLNFEKVCAVKAYSDWESAPTKGKCSTYQLYNKPRRRKHIPYQPLLIKPIFSLLTSAEKIAFFKVSPPVIGELQAYDVKLGSLLDCRPTYMQIVSPKCRPSKRLIHVILGVISQPCVLTSDSDSEPILIETSNQILPEIKPVLFSVMLGSHVGFAHCGVCRCSTGTKFRESMLKMAE